MVDAARVRDPVHNAELSQCTDCHSQVSFVPSRFRHATYALQGAHVTLPCRSCHVSGTYAGTPDACVGCHLGDYTSSSTVPNHALLGYSLSCEECHSQVAWSPAKAP